MAPPVSAGPDTWLHSFTLNEEPRAPRASPECSRSDTTVRHAKEAPLAIRPFIVQGDRTDHGGVVIEASPFTDTSGKGIARVGDRVACPRRGHGLSVIVTGDPTMVIDGRPAARHGDRCACGATLMSSQMASVVMEGVQASSESNPAPPDSDNGTRNRATGRTPAPDAVDATLEQFYSLLDAQDRPVSGYRFDLYRAGQRMLRSGTLSSGHTPAFPGAAPLEIVFWLDKAGSIRS